MIRNYFKIAFREFRKHKLFTLINITGLSIGISASLVIFLIVHHDLTFDKFEKDNDRIYRIAVHYDVLGQKGQVGNAPTRLAEALKDQATGIQAITRLYTITPDISVGDGAGTARRFKAQDRVVFTDQQYFNIVNYHWLAGSAQHALDAPNHVVLTAKQARLYFPGLPYDQMIGRVVAYDTLKTTVAGIVQDIADNTDFTFHDLISFDTGKHNKRPVHDEWMISNFPSFVFLKLAPGVPVAKITKQVNAIYLQNNLSAAEQKESSFGFDLQPLSDLHFNGALGVFSFSSIAGKTTLYGLLAIAAFLLLLACINFVNLTTARGAQRAKEIGIRKTMGSSRRQLVIQFLSETFFVTLLAVVVSVMMTPSILKLFGGFISPDIKLDLPHQPAVILFLGLLTVGVSLLSGFYPAIMLSGYKPVLVLKNQSQNSSSKTRSAWLRKSLTVSQFVIAQFFIMATVLVSKQIYYALHKDLGFKKDAIVVIKTPYKTRTETGNRFLLNKFRSIPQLARVSEGGAPPSANGGAFAIGTYIDGKKQIKTTVETKFADENYLGVYHMNLLAGRNVQLSDTGKGILINNTYAQILGFRQPGQAVGKQLNEGEWTIIGVVADFYEHSLHSPIGPVIIFAAGGQFQPGVFHVALKPETAGGNEWKAAIAGMAKAWKEVYPDDDFDYHFYDDTIKQFYENEERTSTLLNWATGLSILISCLGLLGLTIYTVDQRTREIGIRKVFGASVAQIVSLLSRELVWLIVLAFAIVTPVAWYAMNKWMESFADKTSISWWVFAAGGAGMLLAAILTSGLQTVKAAVANPVKSLRSE